MTRQQIKKLNIKYLESIDYKMVFWKDFDYSILEHIMYRIPSGRRKDKKTYNEVIIMLDTETSKMMKNTHDKKGKIIPVDNIIVCWSLSIRAYDRNIVTLYGRKPSDISKCLHDIQFSMKGDKTYVFVHNLCYDWHFIRRFLFVDFGTPVNQLNVKPHVPLTIEFVNGIILRDSLILCQRSLEKWGKDMQVEHAKAVGSWDYTKLRTQQTELSEEELTYIENDVLCGAECINKLMNQLKKNIISLPFTATGIPREQVQKRGKLNNAHEKFLRICPDYETQLKLEACYHGGFTHGNRHFINTKMENVQGYDFASSYPFVMLSEKFPCSKFKPLNKLMKVNEVIRYSDKYAFIVNLIMIDVQIKDDNTPMPALQFSKCVKIINPILDNGRVLSAAYAEIWVTETDLKIINEIYTWKSAICANIEISYKNYLPRWFTDYIYECFQNKTTLKGGDPVAYALAKSVINSLYGMTVQKPVKETIVEDYETGDYNIDEDFDPVQEYEKYRNKIKSVLPYQWGVWVTSYAFYNLFQLGACAETDMDDDNGGLWLYSDTDSCYGINWNQDKIKAYNQSCIEKLKARGYDGISHNGRMYYLGVAETDGDNDIYTEFKYQGAKRYAGRQKGDGQIHITVAGVPKKTGAKCLKNDLDNFVPGFIFPGTETGKSTHYFMYREQVEIIDGQEVGDSLDLCPCDYLLSSVYRPTWEEITSYDIGVEKYE